MALALNDIAVDYATSQGRLRALGPLSLEIGSGEFLSVLGPSGCGKSTLLKILSGLLRASAGSAFLDGEEIRDPRRDVGIVFQQPTLLPWKTVRENVLMPARVLGIYSPVYAQKADELLALTGLSDFGRHYPHELSGGMQQRVGIARALIHEPKLLLMDEPFAALDALTREQIVIDLQALWRGRTQTVVLITHSIPEAVLMGDRIAVLSPRPGRVLQIEQPGLPRPRTLDTMALPEFVAACTKLRRLLSHPASQPA
jgi:NitT/TauT family transport system ATP-binding protein